MSRRTRLKLRKNQDHFGLGTSHHNQYASSTSYFPKSYSAYGKQIKFPSTAVGFLSQGKLTFYGTIESFEEKLRTLNQEDFLLVHTINIGIKGKIQQQMSQLNNCIVAFSMVCCCISHAFNTSLYRNRYFTKYSFASNSYMTIIEILRKMPYLQSVMLTFQDNFLTKQKFQLLDLNLSKLNLKSLTLRNLSYFMWSDTKIATFQGKIDQFPNLQKSKTQFIFVWEKHHVHYNSKELQEQRQSIASSLCDQL